jgi:hypothetical protein
MNRKTYFSGNACLIIAMSLTSNTLLAADKAHWGKAKHKCTTGTNGLVSAQLKGVKLGKKMKTCEGKDGNTPPPFNARGASGKPNYCKTWPAGVYGYWEIKNDEQCVDGKKQKGNQDPYWDKPKHRCTAPGKGRVEARLLGVDGKWWGKKGRKYDLCNGDNAPSINAFGVSGRPSSCKKRAVHVYGIWENSNDEICTPSWGEVKNKGCMGPRDEGSTRYRQVSRSKITKLKNGGRWWQVNKWKWPLTDNKRKWAREACMGLEHPTKGKPDYCKIKAGVWAYWYKDVQSCDTPLEWAKFKDDGCVKDMANPNLPGSNLDITGKRSYSARLKKVAGDWYESCRTWPIKDEKAWNGTVLNATRPSGCVIQKGDEVAGIVAGGALSAGAAYFSFGTTTGASGAIAVTGSAATTAALKSMDTATSVDGVLWVDDASCR